MIECIVSVDFILKDACISTNVVQRYECTWENTTLRPKFSMLWVMRTSFDLTYEYDMFAFPPFVCVGWRRRQQQHCCQDEPRPEELEALLLAHCRYRARNDQPHSRCPEVDPSRASYVRVILMWHWPHIPHHEEDVRACLLSLSLNVEPNNPSFVRLVSFICATYMAILPCNFSLLHACMWDKFVWL